ncbi:MAG: glycosyltransferase [Lachnospiraceae bacterium]|nr:glycosyltransferase [Lachnospiraceae bacterium]MDE7238488.1 glycosyltransferase [Lachnospiraceae bacterium]
MKVVNLATTDLGGSYKAVERIHRALCMQSVDSVVLLRTKFHEDSMGTQVIDTPLKSLLSKAKNVGNLLLSKGEIISDCFGTNMSKHPAVRDADVIILHWVNSFISYRNVEQLLALGKPVIWVAHDMWNCTGGCHYDRYCGRYEQGCGKCPLIGSKKENDRSCRNFDRKARAVQQSGSLTLVGPSKWSAECAERSRIWQGRRITWIYNPIDYDQYRRLEKEEALRAKYGVTTDKKIILFGACGALSNRTKGAQNLLKALQKLDTDSYLLAVFGNKDGERMADCPLETHYFGYIRSEEEMTEVYNLADVFLAPSEQESFCYTVGEALACGTPVVAFRIGGIAEQVTHQANGYLAEYGSYEQLAEGIRFCTERPMQYIRNENSLSEIGRQYRRLFEELLREKEDE